MAVATVEPIVPKAPPTDDDSAAPDDTAEVAPENPPAKAEQASASPTPRKPVPESRPHARVEDDEDEEEDDELDLDDDEDLVVYTAREAAGAVATIYAFIRPSAWKLSEGTDLRRHRPAGRDAVQRHHAAQPQVPDRRCARRGRFRRPGPDPVGACGRRHHHFADLDLV